MKVQWKYSEKQTREISNIAFTQNKDFDYIRVETFETDYDSLNVLLEEYALPSL